MALFSSFFVVRIASDVVLLFWFSCCFPLGWVQFGLVLLVPLFYWLCHLYSFGNWNALRQDPWTSCKDPHPCQGMHNKWPKKCLSWNYSASSPTNTPNLCRAVTITFSIDEGHPQTHSGVSKLVRRRWWWQDSQSEYEIVHLIKAWRHRPLDLQLNSMWPDLKLNTNA